MCTGHDRRGLDRRSLLKAGAATGAAAGALAGFAATGAQAADPAARPDEATVRSLIEGWPETATKAATAMLGKYGPPDEATAGLLIWRNNGPWRRTIVYREEVDHNFPMPHKDVLEQVIPYAVHPDRFDELANYDGSVIAERTKGELAARCDKEAANFLALNLANDILQGTRSVEEARRFYTETIQALMAGESPPYTQGFQFEVPEGDVGDPGQRTIEKA